MVAMSGTALAQTVPQAECPQGTECPQPEPVAEPVPPPEPIEPPPAPEPQPEPYVTTEPAPATPVIEEPTSSTLERYGIAVSLGGGVAGFTGDDVRDATDDGGAWGVRVAYGLRSAIGIEAEYIGSAQGIDALGLESDAVLVGNGLQAAARVNLLDYNVQPFVFGGVAWRRYTLADEGINTSDVADDDDVLEFPLGVGVAWKYRGFMLDARGEFRLATEEDLIPDPDNPDDTASLHRYGVTANIGYAF
jgi:hypothetical protein